MRVAPDQSATNGLRVWIDQKLVCIEAQTPLGVVGAVNAVAVGLSWQHIIKIAVPDILGPLGERYAFDFATAMAIEQTELDPFGVGGKEREVRSAAVPSRPQGMRLPGREPHATAREREKLPQGVE